MCEKSSDHPDVTGGMEGKLHEAAKIAASGVVVFIVECGTEHAATAMRGQQPVEGTTMVLESILSSLVPSKQRNNIT